MDELKAESSGGTVLAISGMTCTGCAGTVTRVLSRVPGVETAKVDFETGCARIAGTARPEDLISAIEAAGYGAQISDSANSGEQDECGRNDCC